MFGVYLSVWEVRLAAYTIFKRLEQFSDIGLTEQAIHRKAGALSSRLILAMLEVTSSIGGNRSGCFDWHLAIKCLLGLV